jgi:hypothetical protein
MPGMSFLAFYLWLVILRMHFVSNIFALGQAEQFCILCVHMDSCCTPLNCTTVHSRLPDWFTLPKQLCIDVATA